MTKAELVDKIAKESSVTVTKDQVVSMLKATIEALSSALKAGDSVTLTGFGTFKVVERAARNGRNPRTKEVITIPASKTARFTPGKQLRDAIKG